MSFYTSRSTCECFCPASPSKATFLSECCFFTQRLPLSSTLMFFCYAVRGPGDGLIITRAHTEQLAPAPEETLIYIWMNAAASLGFGGWGCWGVIALVLWVCRNGQGIGAMQGDFMGHGGDVCMWAAFWTDAEGIGQFVMSRGSRGTQLPFNADHTYKKNPITIK